MAVRLDIDNEIANVHDGMVLPSGLYDLKTRSNGYSLMQRYSYGYPILKCHIEYCF